mmetsp:Transcript_574/g.925  ORF Transcript_574/g.925 Transcript_574/m.925 type:complete len:243 (+) Transcript_574:232-960(+)
MSFTDILIFTSLDFFFSSSLSLTELLVVMVAADMRVSFWVFLLSSTLSTLSSSTIGGRVIGERMLDVNGISSFFACSSFSGFLLLVPPLLSFDLEKKGEDIIFLDGDGIDLVSESFATGGTFSLTTPIFAKKLGVRDVAGGCVDVEDASFVHPSSSPSDVKVVIVVISFFSTPILSKKLGVCWVGPDSEDSGPFLDTSLSVVAPVLFPSFPTPIFDKKLGVRDTDGRVDAVSFLLDSLLLER